MPIGLTPITQVCSLIELEGRNNIDLWSHFLYVELNAEGLAEYVMGPPKAAPHEPEPNNTADRENWERARAKAMRILFSTLRNPFVFHKLNTETTECMDIWDKENKDPAYVYWLIWELFAPLGNTLQPIPSIYKPRQVCALIELQGHHNFDHWRYFLRIELEAEGLAGHLFGPIDAMPHPDTTVDRNTWERENAKVLRILCSTLRNPLVIERLEQEGWNKELNSALYVYHMICEVFGTRRDA
ncbi:hypothetical protein B0T20DRAFT_431215 [Sordaria brevicollis]|uniref:Uncharacterized protein n=1 Tax=Sordaria brevicollis TaxID=83679 RepID=A0AAE0PL60_SORBR|nr:hypothetical protein B0T20DRAFT_431215 [Sordaria brevicollis]